MVQGWQQVVYLPQLWAPRELSAGLSVLRQRFEEPGGALGGWRAGGWSVPSGRGQL